MEMMEAINIAEERNISIELLDRDIAITLKRALADAGILEKIKLLFSIIVGIFSEEEELTEEAIEEMMQGDAMTELLQELSEHMPSFSRAVIQERDIYIANKILQAKGKKIVAVVGAGHLNGIKKYLDKKRPISNLLEVPKKRNYISYLKYIIPASFMVILSFGLYFRGLETVLDILLLWIIINGGFSALGTLLAWGHPLSIGVAFIAAPLTSLHPAVAAGWFVGLIEAKMRSPRVKDFESLSQLTSFKGFYTNRVTHLLLVVAFANIGSIIGTILALPYALSILR
jgi:pheromone shutdown-related protein TraB